MLRHNIQGSKKEKQKIKTRPAFLTEKPVFDNEKK